MTFDQTEYDVRCEWGPQEIAQLAPGSDAVIVVDVMSFTTCVSVAVGRGASVFPYRFRDSSACEFAGSVRADLAGPRETGGFSLSPASLLGIARGARLVLPSPNGSTLTLMTGAIPTFAGCLRNCEAVARAAMRYGPRISVIPAGERWKGDDSLRPAIEDLVGAGAIIHCLKGSRSPESEVALAAFCRVQEHLLYSLNRCSSGRELIGKGFEGDIVVMAELNADRVVPIVREGAYVGHE